MKNHIISTLCVLLMCASCSSSKSFNDMQSGKGSIGETVSARSADMFVEKQKKAMEDGIRIGYITDKGVRGVAINNTNVVVSIYFSGPTNLVVVLNPNEYKIEYMPLGNYNVKIDGNGIKTYETVMGCGSARVSIGKLINNSDNQEFGWHIIVNNKR